MPLYSWHCRSCDAARDVFASVAERDTPEKCACGKAMRRVLTLPQVMPDLAPYIAVAGDRAGKPIEGRKAHREFLKRNGFHEVGNEPIRPVTNHTRPSPGAVREEMKRVVPEVLRKHRNG